jgi:hypothetical protein
VKTRVLIFPAATAFLLFALGFIAGHRAMSAQAKDNAAVEIPIPESLLAWDATVKEVIAGPHDKEAQFTFNVTNVSSSQIVVSSVSTSCGCTVAKLPSVPWILRPGTNGQIHATMKLAGLGGIVMKSLTVNTDKGQKLLFVRANIPIPEKSGTAK